jgi:hypothetical protein
MKYQEMENSFFLKGLNRKFNYKKTFIKLIYFLFFFVTILSITSCGNNKEDEKLVRINEIRFIRIDSLQVSTNNFQVAYNNDTFTWDEASTFIQKKGNDWRLPTKEEFEFLKKYRLTLEKQMSIENGGYWTALESIVNKDAWQSSFDFDFLENYYSKNRSAHIILVRNIK